MRRLNEAVARMANAEDGCTGRFWEGRFKSQVLPDEKAMLAAMAYVDLSPVRAGMVETPEASDHISIQERLQQVKTAGKIAAALADAAHPPEAGPQAASGNVQANAPAQAPLMPFDARGELPWAISFGWQEYGELVDWTGRQARPDKRSHVDGRQPPLLARLGLEGDAFAGMACHLLARFGVAVGAPPAMARLCVRKQRRFLHGQRVARRVFSPELQKVGRG